MNIEYQLQIDAIKGSRIHFKQYGDLILIVNGYVGVYLTQSQLKINRSTMIEAFTENKATSYMPEELLKDRSEAIETKIAYKLLTDGYAIKLCSKESDAYCYVKEKYLKMFKGYGSLYIKSPKDPVLVYRYGKPYGIILPVYVGKEEGE